MPRINEHYLNLRAAYLFAKIRRRQQAYGEAQRCLVYVDTNVVAGRAGADQTGRASGRAARVISGSPASARVSTDATLK
jgi:hypothetical protein